MALTDLLSRSSSPANQEKVIQRLSAQMQVNQQLAALTSLDDLLWRGAEAKDLVEAEQLFIYAIDGDDLFTRRTDPKQTGKAGGVRIPLAGNSIPAHVARTAEVVNLEDIRDADSLHAIAANLTYETAVFAPLHGAQPGSQILCAPVVHEGATIGVIEAVGKATGEGFDFMDVACLQEAARNLASRMHQVGVMQLQSERLTYTEKFNRIVAGLHAAPNIDDILLSLHHDLVDLFHVDRVTIYAVDHNNNELYSKAKEVDSIREIRVPIDHSSIAGHCAATESVLRFTDVYDAAELARVHHGLIFNQSFDKRSGLRTRQMLVAPLVFEGRLHGVVQMMNPLDRHAFSDRDVESVRSIADALAVAFANKAHTAQHAVRSPYDRLIANRLISEAQLLNARSIARENALYVEDVLRQEHNVSKEAILASLQEHSRRKTLDLDLLPPVPPELVKLCMPLYERMKNGKWVPVAADGNRIVVAMENPRDLGAVEKVEGQFMGRAVDVRAALQSDIIRTIDKYYGASGDGEETTVLLRKRTGTRPIPGGTKEKGTDRAERSERTAVAPLAAETPDDALRQIRQEFSNLSEIDEEDHGAQLVRLVNLIIEQAYHKGASDIHLEPYMESDLVVRYRVDGDLRQELQVPKELRNALVSRVKIMSELDISERRKPQDGKIKYSKFGRLDIELRVATLPTTGGCEDVVMRILAASKPIPLDKIGMSKRNYAEFTKLVETPYGIVLCVGPTGSGKTTTLHSALGFINKPDVKIWTAEDPVEITQRGLRQVQVNPKTGLTFAAAMRSFLRADPDVIMVGEMRDHETAAMGIEASLTGHLVFSTLHTNNAPETVTRLLNMDVDVFAFSDALLGILAQRLARTLCSECKQTRRGTAQEYDELRSEYGADQYFDELAINPRDFQLPEPKVGGSCAKCGGSGYKGRMGLHELLVRSDEIRTLIYKKSKADDIRQVALAEGMRTLKQDGIHKILAGHLDLAQVRTVCTQ